MNLDRNRIDVLDHVFVTLLERVLPHSIALFHEYRKVHA